MVEPDSTSDPREAAETRIFTSPVARGAATEDSPPAPPPPAHKPVPPQRAPLARAGEVSGPPRYGFSPPNPRRKGWAESRKEIPNMMVWLVIFGDAAALAVYFATR